jgi:uncharacterized protein YprB with RNaseH-like and TPR domain
LSLANKLRRLIPPASSGPAPATTPAAELDSFLHGREVTTPVGACYVIDKAIPLEARHGHWRLGEALHTNYGTLGQPQPLDVKTALFLDTETTGLAGGTGTYAFLVGLGSFTSSHFLVKQLLMRDYNEELAVLYLLEQELQEKDTIISFNGKTFDIPLLQTRFTMARLGLQGCAGKKQLDLLHLARRIWRHKLKSCSLSSLEINILGVRRLNDIPGSEIPGRYFQFLHTGQGQLLQDIIEHNTLDILSMATLLFHIQQTLRLPPGECNCPWEAEALAKLALGQSNFSLGLLYLDAARQLCHRRSQYLRLLRTTALVYKRLRNYEQACALWQEILQLAYDDLDTYEELAKYYEHRAKDLTEAERVTRRALAIAWQAKSAKAADLKHRLRRIRNKAQTSAST